MNARRRAEEAASPTHAGHRRHSLQKLLEEHGTEPVLRELAAAAEAVYERVETVRDQNAVQCAADHLRTARRLLRDVLARTGADLDLKSTEATK